MELMYEILNAITNNLALLIAPTPIIYITSSSIRNLFVRKNNKIRNWKIAKEIPNNPKNHTMMAYFDKQNLNKLNSSKIPEELKEIVVTFQNYIKENEINANLENIITCKINHITLENDILNYLKNLISFFTSAGKYFSTTNTINLYSIKKDVLSHEFLHMVSTQNPNKTGFRITTRFDNKQLGHGINEGYTELLNQRIFQSKTNGYPHNVKIAKLLETFFDNQNELEKAYFTSNFDMLYLTFLNYGTKEEFFEVMTNLDNLATTKNSIYNSFNSIKLQLKLYQIIKRSNNLQKIQNFENILNENLLIKLLKQNKIALSNSFSKKSKTK